MLYLLLLILSTAEPRQADREALHAAVPNRPELVRADGAGRFD